MSISFAQLGLTPELVAAVTSAGYENPTPIQERAIPALLAGKDIVGQAQTGTGKTAAYGLPLLQSVAAPGPIQALILSPTRELTIQVSEQLQSWSKQVRTLAVYGGQPIPLQFKALRQGVQVVVATPGRLIDHMERGSISLEHLKYCVLDEADEMLDFGFEEELDTILAQVPSGCRMALFSATFPSKIKQLAGRHMAQAERIEIESKERTVNTVEQFYCLVRPGMKARSLGRLLDHQDPGPTLVFCRTRMETQQLTDELRRRGYAAECLHGEMDQSERERVMDRFRQNQCRILVATDIAARGLDVDGITHVFNYDIPWDVEHYIHRVGRTARAGRTGVAITVIEPSQQRHLQRIERESGARFKAYPVPSMDQITTGRVKRFAERIRQQLEDPTCQEQLPLARALAKTADPLAVAAAALQALWQNSYSAMAEEQEEDLAPRVKQFVWISLSVGRRDEMNPADLLRCMQEETGTGKSDLGKIHIEDNRTVVEVPAEKADRIILDLRRIRLKGKRIKVDLSTPPMMETRRRPERTGRGGPRAGFVSESTGKPHGEKPPFPRKPKPTEYQPAGRKSEGPKRSESFPPAGGFPAKPRKEGESPRKKSDSFAPTGAFPAKSKKGSGDKRTWVGQPDKPRDKPARRKSPAK